MFDYENEVDSDQQVPDTVSEMLPPVKPLPMPLIAALDDEDIQTLKQEIPGYMLEPTRSYAHWIVNQELFCFYPVSDLSARRERCDRMTRGKRTGLISFSVSGEMASAYGSLLEFLYSQRSRTLSPRALQLVSLAAQTVFHFSTITLRLNQDDWPLLPFLRDVNRELAECPNTAAASLAYFHPIASIASKLAKVVSLNQEIHDNLSHLCQYIRDDIDLCNQKGPVAVSEALSLIQHLCDLYDIIILAAEQVMAMIRPIPAQYYQPDNYHSRSLDAVAGVYVPGLRIRAGYEELKLCFQPDQQPIAPLLLDSRWSIVLTRR